MPDDPRRKLRRLKGAGGDSQSEERFACEFPGCGKSYKYKTSLKVHLRSHDPEKLYTCTVPGCTKSFTRSYLCRRHVERHQNWNSLNPVNDERGDSSADHPLKKIAKQRWIAAIELLIQGYKSRNGNGFVPPAVIAPNGCHLPQRRPIEGGYILIQPVALFNRKVKNNEPNQEIKKDGVQKAHRVVCYLTKSEDDVHNLLYRGYHASHLCHQPGCINPDHLVVETQAANESRKMCSTKANVKISVNGRDYLLKAEGCPHSPLCVIKLETRAAIEL
ncbi:hypothetical protein V1505DRAFT_147484 [Lipomyces doorenjongii]